MQRTASARRKMALGKKRPPSSPPQSSIPSPPPPLLPLSCFGCVGTRVECASGGIFARHYPFHGFGFLSEKNAGAKVSGAARIFLLPRVRVEGKAHAR